MVDRSLPAGKRFKNPSGLSATPATQFGHGNRHGQTFDDVTRVPPQQAFVGPGQAVFGQTANYLEQRRSHLVVKILARECFLSRPREPGTHVTSELVSGIRRNRRNKHLSPPISGSRSGILRIRIGNGPGTSYEMCAEACRLPYAPSLLLRRSVLRQKSQPS